MSVAMAGVAPNTFVAVVISGRSGPRRGGHRRRRGRRGGAGWVVGVVTGAGAGAVVEPGAGVDAATAAGAGVTAAGEAFDPNEVPDTTGAVLDDPAGCDRVPRKVWSLTESYRDRSTLGVNPAGTDEVVAAPAPACSALICCSVDEMDARRCVMPDFSRAVAAAMAADCADFAWPVAWSAVQRIGEGEAGGAERRRRDNDPGHGRRPAPLLRSGALLSHWDPPPPSSPRLGLVVVVVVSVVVVVVATGAVVVVVVGGAVVVVVVTAGLGVCAGVAGGAEAVGAPAVVCGGAAGGEAATKTAWGAGSTVGAGALGRASSTRAKPRSCSRYDSRELRPTSRW